MSCSRLRSSSSRRWLVRRRTVSCSRGPEEGEGNEEGREGGLDKLGRYRRPGRGEGRKGGLGRQGLKWPEYRSLVRI